MSKENEPIESEVLKLCDPLLKENDDELEEFLRRLDLFGLVDKFSLADSVSVRVACFCFLTDLGDI